MALDERETADDFGVSTELQEKYPHVATQAPWAFKVVDHYGSKLNNTGGNDPLDLLNDYLNPGTNDRPNRLMTTNIVRFTLASMVWSQVQLLQLLLADGTLG